MPDDQLPQRYTKTYITCTNVNKGYKRYIGRMVEELNDGYAAV